MKEKYLPIGSIVLLRGGIKRLMIIGIMQYSKDKPDQEFDYTGVLYQEGFLGENTMFLFNHDDINDVIFIGYENFERKEFLKKIEKMYEKNEY